MTTDLLVGLHVSGSHCCQSSSDPWAGTTDPTAGIVAKWLGQMGVLVWLPIEKAGVVLNLGPQHGPRSGQKVSVDLELSVVRHDCAGVCLRGCTMVTLDVNQVTYLTERMIIW